MNELPFNNIYDYYNINNSILTRVLEFEHNAETFNEIERDCCFNFASKQRIVSNYKKKDKHNLNHYIKIHKKIKSGSFNSVYLITHNDDNENFYAIRIPKTEYNIHRCDLFQDDDIDNEAHIMACISSRYAYIFSQIVRQNIFPNFLQIVDVFFCNNKFPITIQEHADSDLYEILISKCSNIYMCENLIVQSLITFYFMNIYLKLSHNDAKPSNVLVKMIDNESTDITYDFGDNILSLKTQKLALITDFDYTRGTHCRYDMLFILEAYIKTLSITNKYYSEIKQYYNKIVSGNKYIIDIVQFLILILLYRVNDIIKMSVNNFLHDYLINNHDFFYCLKKNYPHIVTFNKQTCDTDNIYYINNIDPNTITHIDFFKYKKLLYRVMVHTDYHGNYGDEYIKRMFKLDRFVFFVQDIVEKNHNIDSNLLYTNYAKSLNNQTYTKIIERFIKFKLYYKISTYEILTSINMIIFYLKYHPEVENTQILELVCLYLVNFQHYSLKILKHNMLIDATKQEIYNVLKNVLLTLYLY